MPYLGKNSSAQELMHNWAFCLKATAKTDGFPIKTSGNLTSLPDRDIPSISGNLLSKKISFAFTTLKNIRKTNITLN